MNVDYFFPSIWVLLGIKLSPILVNAFSPLGYQRFLMNVINFNLIYSRFIFGHRNKHFSFAQF